MKLSAESIVACSEQGFVQQRPGGFGMVLDCSSHVPLSSMPVSAGMFCPHQTAPLPHWRNLPGREEETLGGFLRSAGCGREVHARDAQQDVLVPIKMCQSCDCSEQSIELCCA